MMRTLVAGGFSIGLGVGFSIPTLVMMFDCIGKREWVNVAVYALVFLICIGMVVSGTFIVRMRNAG